MSADNQRLFKRIIRYNPALLTLGKRQYAKVIIDTETLQCYYTNDAK